MRVFCSVLPEDRAIQLDIQNAIKTLWKGQSLDFWQPQGILEQDYRPKAQDWLTKTQLAIIVHGPDYHMNLQCSWEKDAIIAEKQRRPNQLQVVVVHARHAAKHTSIRGFTGLPAEDEAVSGPKYEAQIVRVAQQILHIHAGKTSVTTWNAGSNQQQQQTGKAPPPPITLADLRERLLELADRYNLSDVLLLLKTIVYDADLLRQILQLEDDFIGVHLRARLQFADYQVVTSTINERTKAIIHELMDENLMQSAWRSIFLEMYRTSANREALAFFLSYEEIQIPETLNLPVTTDDIGSAERVGLLSYEQKLEYRRSLVLCQDDLKIEKPARAHGHADKVRTQIDPMSAQLYEYLLIAYVKKEGPANVMRRFLEGIRSDFNVIKLYSDRFELYQNGQPQRCPTPTGRHNRHVLVEELASGLQQQYNALTGTAILDTGERSPEGDDLRKSIHRCLDALFALYQSLVPTTIFIEAMILEIIGSGKSHWMQRMEIRDEQWQFVGNADFDLLGKINELLLLLDKSEHYRPNSTVRPDWKQREMLREDLFTNLYDICWRLHSQIIEEQQQNYNRTDRYASVIRIIRACVFGHHALTQEGDRLEEEKSLLRLALELLLPNLLAETQKMDVPESLVMHWFDLDAQGQLTNAAICAEYDFDAVSILRKIVIDKAGPSAWEIIQKNACQEVWSRYTAHTDALYESVKEALKYDDFRRMNDLEARKRIVECLRRWEVSRQTYATERGQTFQHKIMDELTGQGLLMWFRINPLAIKNHPDALYYGYDPRQALEAQMALPNARTDTEVTRDLIGSLYLHQILPAWEAIKKGDESKRAEVADLMGEILLCFQKHPVPLYLDLVYNELTEATKLRWIGIDYSGRWHNIGSHFDAISVLQQLFTQLPGRYDMLGTRRKLADLISRELIENYYRDISEMRYENRLPERKMCANTIWGLKGVYQFYPDIKYLEIPWTELFGEGRVRWFARFLGIFATNGNHFENALIPFDLRAERIELEMYRKKAAELFAKMMEEINTQTT
jgi:hypothetical protein